MNGPMEWRPEELPPPNEEPVQAPKRSSRGLAIAVMVLFVAAAGGAAWYVWHKQQPAPVPPPPQTVASPVTPVAPGEDADPAADPKTLKDADGQVRDWAHKMSKAPELDGWLASGDLVRKLAGVVYNVAEGDSPRLFLPFLAPKDRFTVRTTGDESVIAPESFARYDGVARVLSGIDAQTAAQAVKALHPLLKGAWKEIAPPGTTFEGALKKGIDHLLATPVPQGDISVTPKLGLFVYSDPALEQLTAAQKHLLRMGPQNEQAIQAKLRELRTALGP